MTPNPDDVARYLQDNPQFFEQYADLLAEIYVPHPHGGRAIPISERQIVTLREKNRVLEAKLKELIGFGEENDAISEKMHRLTLALVAASGAESAIATLHYHLREDFAVPHGVLRLFRAPAGAEGLPEATAVSQELQVYAESLQNPACSAKAMFETPALFGEAAEHLRSFAYVPLRKGETLGLLILASEDAARFYPEMGTLYLSRLGELTATVLTRPGGSQ